MAGANAALMRSDWATVRSLGARLTAIGREHGSPHALVRGLLARPGRPTTRATSTPPSSCWRRRASRRRSRGDRGGGVRARRLAPAARLVRRGRALLRVRSCGRTTPTARAAWSSRRCSTSAPPAWPSAGARRPRARSSRRCRRRSSPGCTSPPGRRWPTSRRPWRSKSPSPPRVFSAPARGSEGCTTRPSSGRCGTRPSTSSRPPSARRRSHASGPREAGSRWKEALREATAQAASRATS